MTRSGIRGTLALSGWFLVGGGCAEDSVNPAQPGDGDASIADAAPDGETCQTEQAALIAFVQANKACTTDDDCIHVDSRGDIREHCSGGFYLNVGYDKATLAALEGPVSACLGKETGACLALPNPAMCWKSGCASSEYDVATRDWCINLHGTETACTRCLCRQCFVTCGPTCAPLLACARTAGCLGTPACDPANAEFPCKAELEQAGDAKSYNIAVSCLADWQCLDECASEDGG